MVALVNGHGIIGDPRDLQRFICRFDSVLAHQTHVKLADEDCGRYLRSITDPGQ